MTKKFKTDNKKDITKSGFAKDNGIVINTQAGAEHGDVQPKQNNHAKKNIHKIK